MQRTSTIATIPTPPEVAAERDREALRSRSSAPPPAVPLTRTAARGRSRRHFALPLRFSVAATGLVAAAIALALYLRF